MPGLTGLSKTGSDQLKTLRSEPMSLFQLAAYGAGCAFLSYLVPRRFRWILLLAASLGFYAIRAASGLPPC